jgi:hypothetical protein
MTRLDIFLLFVKINIFFTIILIMVILCITVGIILLKFRSRNKFPKKEADTSDLVTIPYETQVYTRLICIDNDLAEIEIYLPENLPIYTQLMEDWVILECHTVRFKDKVPKDLARLLSEHTPFKQETKCGHLAQPDFDW